jgi:hypothetical protein
MSTGKRFKPKGCPSLFTNAANDVLDPVHQICLGGDVGMLLDEERNWLEQTIDVGG